MSNPHKVGDEVFPGSGGPKMRVYAIDDDTIAAVSGSVARGHSFPHECVKPWPKRQIDQPCMVGEEWFPNVHAAVMDLTTRMMARGES